MLEDKYYSLEPAVAIVPFVLQLDKKLTKSFCLFHAAGFREGDNRFETISVSRGRQVYESFGQFATEAPQLSDIVSILFQPAYRKIPIFGETHSVWVSASRHGFDIMGENKNLAGNHWAARLSIAITGWGRAEKDKRIARMFSVIEKEMHVVRPALFSSYEKRALTQALGV